MIDKFWWLITWCIEQFPWLVMAAVAALVLMKRKKSLPLILQVLGAGGYFVATVISEICLRVLYWMKAYDTATIAGHVFGFLLIVSLLIFMAGFCMEKLKQWHETKAVAAVPVA